MLSSHSLRLLESESELDFCQDEYDELKDECEYVSVGSTVNPRPTPATESTRVKSERCRPLSTKNHRGSHGENTLSAMKESEAREVCDNHLYEIKVDPLTMRGVQELIIAALALDTPLREDTLTIIMDVTHGNPSLLWKIIRYFNDSDYKIFDQAISQLCDNSLIVSLIEGFTNVQKNVLKYCATIGEEFSFTVLLSVFPKNEKHLTRAQLYDVMTDLMNSGLIVRISKSYFSFKSSLIRKFIYALIPPSVAALMHCEIGKYTSIYCC